MNIQEALNYIYVHGWHQMDRTLERLEKLLDILGRPQDNLEFIHLAGTNGKGSTAAMIEAILREEGYQVGLFTSPYLESFGERIQINRENIKDEDLIKWVLEIQKIEEIYRIDLSLFDLVTAIALLHFNCAEVDYVVWETGLGGRLDATNVIGTPLVTIITPIGLDHQGVLGNHLADIAQEKAGIIKSGTQLVIAPQEKESLIVLENVVHQLNVVISKVDMTEIRDMDTRISDDGVFLVFSYKLFLEVELSLLGRYQLINGATALEVAEVLLDLGVLTSRKKVISALSSVRWAGRFECIRKEPLLYIEGAHNEMGILSLLENIDYYLKGKEITFILGFMEDKDYEKMIELLVKVSQRFLIYQPQVPRALRLDKLKELILRKAPKAEVYPCESMASIQRYMEALPQSVYIGTGSLYLVGELRGRFRE